MAKLLSGVRVLDLSRVYSGPHCTLLLSDFGAEVIKVERPGSGDEARQLPPIYRGQSYFFTELNRGKKSITLNLKDEEGRRLLFELMRSSNVLAMNFTPDVVRALGLSYEAVREAAPHIIYLSMTGFGLTGPLSELLAYDTVVTAEGGLMNLTGEIDGMPLSANVAIADHLSSVYAAVAAVAALAYQKDTGRGQLVDLSMQDCIFHLVGYRSLSRYLGGSQIPGRHGSRDPMLIPTGTYATKDGYIGLTITSNEHWRKLLRVMGKEDLIQDARYASLSGRERYKQEVIQMVEDWLKGQMAQGAVICLQNGGVAAGVVRTVPELVDSPHLRGRHMLAELEQPGMGMIVVPGSPFKMSEMDIRIEAPAPALGEHVEEVFSGLLGLSGDKIAELRQRGVI